ncbi:2-amino-4-hydroxy-6-hydroxymethyldihydropteridine diphosphokinase [Ramlibacter albus]|uniref:2-amino-4-hydroxy-6-hydroxymethyldihydropteridine pyrophosphokinase n=1 Tax=Ramlibacter albus TaxID=2079448 RepID=A0A923S4E2_9BURK|nr:2-amino-4-hydroxy-6-hydroxymethyldihydropteridine diphosphokinase [Ramlibacter albus]MBC5767405.1 2-amino-4-hydroxy-6-hydroxymethyldihydropteridine diphosphokinase [Ramlibacter albus]
MTTAYVGLGANLGDVARAVLDAVNAIGKLPGTSVVRRSSLYRTAPVDAGGPDYFNAVIEIDTSLSAHDLLAALQRIELAAGRERPYRNAPRTLDLDVLLYGNERIDSPTLTVPHPRMFERAFVLVPLAEIAPRLVAPEQLERVSDQRITREVIGGMTGGPHHGGNQGENHHD